MLFAAAGIGLVFKGRLWGGVVSIICSVAALVLAMQGPPPSPLPRGLNPANEERLAAELGAGLATQLDTGNEVLVMAGPSRPDRLAWTPWQAGLSRGTGKAVRATLIPASELLERKTLGTVTAVVIDGSGLEPGPEAQQRVIDLVGTRPVALFAANGAPFPEPLLNALKQSRMVVAVHDTGRGLSRRIFGPPIAIAPQHPPAATRAEVDDTQPGESPSTQNATSPDEQSLTTVEEVNAAMESEYVERPEVSPIRIGAGKASLGKSEPAGAALDAERGFRAWFAHDDRNLYLRMNVTSPAGMVNASNDPTRLFHAGNAIDVQIATEPGAERQKRVPARGDLRLLITRKGEKPMAVIYRPKIGTDGEAIAIQSLRGRTLFESIRVIDPVAFEYHPEESAFTVEATIKLADLGWKPVKGQRVRFDVGYVFGNEDGSKAVGRRYWRNVGFRASVINDLAGESALEPWEWGQAEVE